MKINENIDFFVFDLGGVIIDLDIPFTLRQLGAHTGLQNKVLAEKFMAHPVHHAFEKGEINEVIFREEIRKNFKTDWKDDRINEIWNSMLLQIPIEKINLLKTLRKTHPVYMLSNTNPIHYAQVEKILKRDTGIENFEGLFDHIFLSHEMGCRKPDLIIYKKVLAKVNRPASRGMFFDDTAENLAGAEMVGLQTYHINHPNALMDYFSDVQ